MNSKLYKQIKWFFVILSAITFFIMAYLFLTTTEPTSTNHQSQEKPSLEITNGTLTNEVFSVLIENNIAEFGFVEKVSFSSQKEGHFSIRGTISSAERLIAACKDLQPFEKILNTLEGEAITINGHLGENESGNGCFIADTITVSGVTISAGVATDYIEEYTGLNALLEVPVEQIEISEKGITFKENLPTIIQTALYK